MRAIDLLAPSTPRHFLEEVYGRRPVVLGEPSDRFAHLLPLPLLSFALIHRRVEGLRLRVTSDARSVPVDEYTRTLLLRRGAPATTVRADAAAALLREGATLAIDDVDEFAEEVADLLVDVERLFRESVGVNAYLSGGSTQGFATHWDPHDVLAVQVLGRKTWRLYGATRPAPLVRDFTPAPPPEGEPEAVHDLQAGQVLYLPRGWWHTVEAAGEPSLHLAFGIRRKTGIDLVSWLADVLREQEEFRRDVPRLDRDGHGPYMDELKHVLDNLWNADLLGRYLADDDARAPVRRRLSLPELLPGQDRPLTGSDTVRLLAGRPVVEAHASGIAMAVDGQRLTFSSAVEPVIRLLATGRTHIVAELESTLARPDTDTVMAVHHALRHLQLAGLVRVTRGP